MMRAVVPIALSAMCGCGAESAAPPPQGNDVLDLAFLEPGETVVPLTDIILASAAEPGCTLVVDVDGEAEGRLFYVSSVGSASYLDVRDAEQRIVSLTRDETAILYVTGPGTFSQLLVTVTP